MAYKFNIGTFGAKRKSTINKSDFMVLPSPKSDDQNTVEELILNNLSTKHHKLYLKIFSHSVKVRHSKSENKKIVASNMFGIDQVISNHLKKKEQLDHFKTMYSVQVSQQQSLTKYPFMIETKTQKNKLLLKKLSSNPEELSNIFQNSLLQFYHYRDIQKQTQNLTSKFVPKYINPATYRKFTQAKNKIDINYLKKDFQTQKHRRLSQSNKKTEQMYMHHNEQVIQRNKQFNYLKNEKQVKQAVKLARGNISYKKALNQDRIKYLINRLNENKSQIKTSPQYCKILKDVFFKFSNKQGTQKSRYQQMSIDKFNDFFSKLQLNEVTMKQAQTIFYEVISYKSQKSLFFEDFLALINKISRVIYKQNNKNESQKFLMNYIYYKKNLHQEQTHRLYNVYRQQITKYLKRSKMQFCLQLLFKYKDQQPQVIKDLSTLVSVFTSCSLIPPFQSNKMHYFYSYLKTSQNGIDLQLFKQMVVLIILSQQLGLRNSEDKIKLKNLNEGKDSETIVYCLQKYFSKCNMYDKVLSHIVEPKSSF